MGETEDESVLKAAGCCLGISILPCNWISVFGKSLQPQLSKLDANDFCFISWIFEQKSTILVWKMESLRAVTKSLGTLFQKM